LSDKLKLGFEMKGITLPLDQICLLKQISNNLRNSPKYKSILASIKEVGIIEPPVVSHPKDSGTENGNYILLDGHIRIDILKQLGHTKVFCLISTDDEGYTYNNRVNLLSPIQQHFMIMKTIDNGVSEERIAKNA